MLAEMGRYGQKTGRGMYLYAPGSRVPLPDPQLRALIAREARILGIEQRRIDAAEIVERCIYALIVEGAHVLEEGLASRPGDIDAIWLNGFGFPRHRGGPMRHADDVGLGRVLEIVQDFAARFGPKYWEPPRLLVDLAQRGQGFADFPARPAVAPI
jgi:3-hydroxyacyl-CoA dehydrogenase